MMSNSQRRKSLFKTTSKRKEISCNGVEDSYECIYKFDVHAGNDKDVLAVETTNESSNFTPHMVSRFAKRIPSSCKGIFLIFALQWQIPHPVIDSHTVYLDMYYTYFYVSRKTLENTLTNTLSSFLHELGILCPNENRSIVTRLVDTAIPICDNWAATNVPSERQWMSLFVKIAIQRARSANRESSFMEDYYLWGVRDAKRVFLGLRLMKIYDTYLKQDCCPICLRQFEVDCEVVELRICRHVYHSSCIMEWLIKRQRSCPLCRQTVPDDYLWHSGKYLLFLE